jgi:quercetin dioxygenase-like cupin family protein
MATTTALRPASGEAIWVMGGRMTMKASSEDTNGAMSVLMMEVPAGWAAPMHAHAGAEYMYVLDGDAWFTIGDETLRGGAGTSVVIPGDVDENWGADTDARLLIVSTPAGLDAVFSQFGEVASAPGFPRRLTRRHHPRRWRTWVRSRPRTDCSCACGRRNKSAAERTSPPCPLRTQLTHGPGGHRQVGPEGRL